MDGFFFIELWILTVLAVSETRSNFSRTLARLPVTGSVAKAKLSLEYTVRKFYNMYFHYRLISN